MKTLDEYRSDYAWLLDRLRAECDEVRDGIFDYGTAYVVMCRLGDRRRAIKLEFMYIENPDEVHWVANEPDYEDDYTGGHWEPEGVVRYAHYSLNENPDREALVTTMIADFKAQTVLSRCYVDPGVCTTEILVELARAGKREDFAWLAKSEGVLDSELDDLWRGTLARLPKR